MNMKNNFGIAAAGLLSIMAVLTTLIWQTDSLLVSDLSPFVDSTNNFANYSNYSRGLYYIILACDFFYLPFALIYLSKWMAPSPLQPLITVFDWAENIIELLSLESHRLICPEWTITTITSIKWLLFILIMYNLFKAKE